MRAAQEPMEEQRARLFSFLEAGAEEGDFPSFAAALDTYCASVRAEVLRYLAKATQKHDGYVTTQELRRMADALESGQEGAAS